MINYFQYNDPLKIQFRKGTIDDPYVDKVDTQKIVNYAIFLSEIPDTFTHVIVSGYIEIYDDIPASNEFVVNYQNGMVTFNQSEEGKSVIATYKGRGYILYPASRVYLHNENPDVAVSVQDLFDTGKTITDALIDYNSQIMTYQFTQASAATTWTITHNLGKYPSATIVDNSGNVCIGEIVYTSNNVITLTFTSALAGKAYLN